MDQRPNSFFPFSSSSFSGSWTYDVFLSFRGSDTRYHFTGNLYKTLTQKSIRTFIDDRELKGGDEITPSLVKAIKESRIVVVVFSKNYASSSFCLDELATIVEFVKGEGRLVYPIFYEVDPSVVRRQRERYGEAMAKHDDRFKDDMEKVHKWREALRQTANLSGKHVKIGSLKDLNISLILNGTIPNQIPLHREPFAHAVRVSLLHRAVRNAATVYSEFASSSAAAASGPVFSASAANNNNKRLQIKLV